MYYNSNIGNRLPEFESEELILLNSRQIIADYIQPSQRRKATLWVLGAIAAALIAAGTGIYFLFSLKAVGGIVMLAGVLVTGLWGCLSPAYAAARKNMKYTLNRLEELGILDSAAAELTGEDRHIVADDRSRLTPNFAFRRHGGVAIAYDDIVWFMIYPGRSQDIEITTNLRTGRSFQPVSMFNKKSNYDEIRLAYSYITDHCPNAMEGYSQENAKAYRAIVRQHKSEENK